MRNYINIVESTQIPRELLDIAIAFRERMETSSTNSHRTGYLRFEGECNRCSRELAKELQNHGYDAISHLGDYIVDDPEYIEQHGSAIAGWSDGEYDEYPPESHEFVIVDDHWVVDVTADQFHPSNPMQYRVVVTPLYGSNYRK